MILEADRLVADWLADPTNGINAQLALVPLDGSDVKPVDLATITDETRNDTVARGEPAAPYPSLSVSVDSVTDLDGVAQVLTRDGKLKVRMRVAVDTNVTSNAIAAVSYYLRAVLASFRVLCTDAHNAARLRNGVYLETVLDVVEAIDVPKPDQASVTTVSGYLLATMQLREQPS